MEMVMNILMIPVPGMLHSPIQPWIDVESGTPNRPRSLGTCFYFVRYYLGRRPVVVVADPDMLRQIMVKDFSTFPNRMRIRAATKPMSDCLLMLRNEHWKRVRSILTPSFSATKMKEMGPLINMTTDTLLTNLLGHVQSAESFDIHRCFGCFTMDVIASVAFGIQVDSQKDPDDPFVHHAWKFFSFSFFRPIMFVFIAFPFLAPLARVIPNKRRDEMNNFFVNCIQKIIRQRDEQPVEEVQCVTELEKLLLLYKRWECGGETSCS
nr:thromboxane-A synthase-like [Oncorhynchus nerka]